MNKLFKVILPAAGVAMASVVFAPAPAQAVDACKTSSTFTDVFKSGFTCLDQDKLYSDFSFTGTTPFETVSFTNNALDQHQIVFSSATPLTTGGSISYKIAITPAGERWFTAVEVSRTGFSSNVTKTLASSAGSTAIIAPGGPTTVAFTKADNISFFDVTDAWVVNSGGSISSLNNVYTQNIPVPGPLPILGAGMAFGFSRKLRSRIKQSQAV